MVTMTSRTNDYAQRYARALITRTVYTRYACHHIPLLHHHEISSLYQQH